MLVDRIGCSNDPEKYITMPAHRTLATILLILAGALMAGSLQADELKEIARQVQQGKQSSALDRLDAYLKAHPSDPQAMFLKGITLSELNKRDEAIRVFTELTEKHPYLPEPYNNLAVLYAGQGQYDKARKALEAALKTHPSYATAHNNLADVYAHMASEAYDKALQLDKGNTRAGANRLAMIRDLPVAESPVLLAAREPQAAPQATKAPVKAAQPETPPRKVEKPAAAAASPTTPPAAPVKLAEPTKPAEPAIPAVTPKAAAPEQPVTTEKPAVAVKPTQDKPAQAQAAEPLNTPAVAAAPEPAKKTATAASGDSKKDIRQAVDAWALAWSSQNVEKYLSSYADSFQTPNGQSRKQWEDTRRERLTRPGAIKVEIADLRVTMESSERARAAFKQTYRAGSTVMRTSKVLVLKNAGGKWLIEQERTGS